MVRKIEEEELSIPVQCETDPDALNIVVVDDDQTYTVQHNQEGELPTPVQRETAAHGPNHVFEYHDQTYTMNYVGNDQRGHQVLSDFTVQGTRRTISIPRGLDGPYVVAGVIGAFIGGIIVGVAALRWRGSF